MNDNVDLLVRSGWAVQITRKDGTTFLSSSGIGTHPAVWCKSNRKWAVKHKRELLLEGFRCKVVHVKFADPQVERPNVTDEGRGIPRPSPSDCSMGGDA